ncbi:MAG: hypothetical protein A2Z88_04905 [Omnitrophica WOR_2 bacterium GWA2_47_8]|nr:MAG: hypothetical protein A2Z88_04905 [Omnitrophica WOR_2 bacterium GWA2_47_8]
MNTYHWIGAGSLIVIIVLTAAFAYRDQWSRNGVTQLEGDRDTHGCIVSAGYSWCKEKQMCLRIWEETCRDSIKEKVFSLTENDARAIAERICIKGGEALSKGYYNENSRTWWFDANLNATQPGCTPACVVSEETLIAEVNWRCTGAIPPDSL